MDEFEEVQYQCIECEEIHSESCCPECGSIFSKIYYGENNEPSELSF